MRDLTPVIIGVGEAFDAPDVALHKARSPVALAADAARAAFADAGERRLEAMIDAVAMTRTYPDSTPFWPHPATPIGAAPRGLANRLSLPARDFIYEIAGGQSPQALVAEFSDRIARGEYRAVLIAGGDAIATEKNARRAGLTLEWSEDADGAYEDRGLGVKRMLSPHEIANGLVEVAPVYALFENARRARCGRSREDYALDMGALLAPFSDIAARTPGALARRAQSAAEIAAVSERNTLRFDPFTSSVMAKDGVNMGAALILTTAETARALAIAPEKWVYPLASAAAVEKPVMERPRLDDSPAMRAAYEAALETAEIAANALTHLDLYSCFPVAVFIAREALGLDRADPRALTVTGGLPFFGGPGNNYSMHAIIAMARALRLDRDGVGLVGANGGFLTKHAVGVYSSCAPKGGYRAAPSLAASLDAIAPASFDAAPAGEGIIETYTIARTKGVPTRGFAIGRLKGSGLRFLARARDGDDETLVRLAAQDTLGAHVQVERADSGAHFSLASR